MCVLFFSLHLSTTINKQTHLFSLSLTKKFVFFLFFKIETENREMGGVDTFLGLYRLLSWDWIVGLY